MNISSVSSSSNTTNYDSQIKQLEARAKLLQGQVTQENSSKDNAETKKTKIALLQSQIQQIEMQIQKLSAQQSKQTGGGEKSTSAANEANERAIESIVATTNNSTSNSIDVLV